MAVFGATSMAASFGHSDKAAAAKSHPRTESVASLAFLQVAFLLQIQSAGAMGRERVWKEEIQDNL